MADTIDDAVQSHAAPVQGEAHKENGAAAAKHTKGTLENLLGEISDAVKGTINLGIGVAAPAAGYMLTGNAGVPVTSAAFIAASGGKMTSKKIRDESIVGALWGTLVHYFSKPMQYMSAIGKSAYIALLPFIANAVYPTTDHLVKNKSPSGLYDKIKNNYWPNVKKSFTSVWPLNLLAALFLPPAYLVGAVGISNYLYRKIVVGTKEEPEKNPDKTPYLVAGSNALARGIQNVLYAGGSMLDGAADYARSLYKSTPSAPPAPSPAPAGGHP